MTKRTSIPVRFTSFRVENGFIIGLDTEGVLWAGTLDPDDESETEMIWQKLDMPTREGGR